MVCIYCGNNTAIVNSRSLNKSSQTWRRHRCRSCNATFTTNESYSLDGLLLVEHKNGSVESFLRDKLFLSIYQAVDHLIKPEKTSLYLTQTVINKILINKPLNPLIKSNDIVKLAGQTLKHFNAAAAVRYLSYHSQMKLANDVKRLLKS